jgi:MFS family permease
MWSQFGETGVVANAVDEKRAEPARVGSAFGQFLLAIVHLIRGGIRRLGAWNRSHGAAESGLARLVEMHAWQAAGDAFVTVALAGSLFFSVSASAARSRIAVFLIVTMAPFALLAPLLGPLLDRFQHGRRFALAATMLARATLALVIGHELAGKHLSTTEALALYPAALGVLVAQKTYAIARSAAVPRVLPQGLTLVQANSRMTLVGIFAPAIGASFALLITKATGHQGALRVAAIVYIVASVVALRLPPHADGGKEVRARETHPRLGSAFKLGQADSVIASALRSAAVLRWLSGFLLFYGAFVVREHSVGGLPKAVALSALAIGLGAGNFGGTLVGSRLKQSPTARMAVLLLGVTALTTLFTALDFGWLTVFAVAVVSSATASISKLGLDATIQKRVDESVRTTTFARSETTMQLSWVVGGAVGILLPTKPVAVGFLVATAALGAALLVAVGATPKRTRQPTAT